MGGAEWSSAVEMCLCVSTSRSGPFKRVFLPPLTVRLRLCFQVPRVPMHTLAMVVPPQEPDRTPQDNSPPLLGVVKGQYVATRRIAANWGEFC